LKKIDYNPGRYILLEARPSQDADIRDFQAGLRACTEGSLSAEPEDPHAEQCFLQVKELIERFRGREGQSEMDRRWTARVTDVRNWFVFAASERRGWALCIPGRTAENPSSGTFPLRPTGKK